MRTLGMFSTLDLPTLASGEDWLLSYDANDIKLSVESTGAAPTPEPSTLLLLGSGLALALRLRRNRAA